MPEDRVPNAPTVRESFAQAAAFFVSVVGGVRADQWDAPALGVWSVRDLVGHTARALITVETYLDESAERVEVAGPAEYFVKALASANHEAVAQRGREAGAALGPEPATSVRELVGRVASLAAATDPGRLLKTPVGGMRLVDYLPTRTFELVVHTLDLAAALGMAVEPPAPAATACLELAGELSVRRGQAAAVLLALTGRRSLPPGFSLL